MIRALKFIGIFLAVAAGIYAVAIIPNFSAFKTLFTNTEGMREGSEWIEKTFSLQGLTEYIGANKERVSVVSYEVNQPDSGIYFQEDVPRAMGTIQNFFLLAEYERQVEEGIISPGTPVDMEEVNRFGLPQISESIHKEALNALSERTDAAPTIDELVSVMVQFNDLSISNWLWYTLTPSRIDSLMLNLELSQTDSLAPFSGIYLSLRESNEPTRTLQRQLAQRFAEDPGYREQMTNIFKEDRIGFSFTEERDALEFFPKTTAAEMARVMAALWNNALISPAVDERIKQKMGWALGTKTMNKHFDGYGAMYDNRMGLLGGIDFGVSTYDKKPRVQAIFFDRLPVAFWLHMSAGHMHEDYQQRLIWDPALLDATLTQIANND
ncbi:MAG: serine hydrolase [Bacteroidota bacterium]